MHYILVLCIRYLHYIYPPSHRKCIKIQRHYQRQSTMVHTHKTIRINLNPLSTWALYWSQWSVVVLYLPLSSNMCQSVASPNVPCYVWYGHWFMHLQIRLYPQSKWSLCPTGTMPMWVVFGIGCHNWQFYFMNRHEIAQRFFALLTTLFRKICVLHMQVQHSYLPSLWCPTVCIWVNRQ